MVVGGEIEISLVMLQFSIVGSRKTLSGCAPTADIESVQTCLVA